MEKLTTTTLFTVLSLYILISIPNTSARPLTDEKVARFTVYAHEYLPGGQNATDFIVANASITATTQSGFGALWVADKSLTVAPDRKSKEVGRMQGLVAWSDLKVHSGTVNLDFVFTAGKYNGSTITVVGREEEAQKQRENPIVGGTGVFRIARGYMLVETFSTDVSKNHIVLECKIYVVYSDVMF